MSQLKQKIKESNQKKRVGSAKKYNAYTGNDAKGPLRNCQRYLRDAELESALEHSPMDMPRSPNDKEAAFSEVRRMNNVLRKQVAELQDALTVAQASGGGNELLRARALEGARAEIRELREVAEAYRLDKDKLLAGRLDIEEELGNVTAQF